MTTIKLDEKEYNVNSISDEAKAQLILLQFCEAQKQKFQTDAVALQTTHLAYARALKQILENAQKTTKQ